MAGKSGSRESMATGLLTGRRETERPQCPDCGAPDPTSKGIAWVCKTCSRSWQKFTRGNFHKDLPNRPERCSYCLSTSSNGKLVIWGNGNRWWCTSCGKSWLKSKGKYSNRKELGDRPKCQFCKAPEPVSNGVRWSCRTCFKSWYKNNPRPITLSFMELATAKIIEA